MFVLYLTMQRHPHPCIPSETQATNESKHYPPPHPTPPLGVKQIRGAATLSHSHHFLRPSAHSFGCGKHFHDNTVFLNGEESYLSLQSVHTVKLIFCSFFNYYY